MQEINKIIIIGFMGAGKTSVAARLAPHLGFSLCEMDTEIIARSDYPSIAEIFQHKGESHFRDLEAAVASSLQDQKRLVISTGGGVITRPTNIAHLKRNGGVVVYLRTSFATLTSRIEDISTRPLFTHREQALELYDQRAPVYQSHADITIDTDERTVDEVCSNILQKIGFTPCQS